ncbi:MAG: NUDIX domain-containing protein [Pirellulaceae bacterium]
MQPIVSSGFLIFRREPRLSFLLMKHADRWDLPKGHLDGAETELAAACRELEEETGIPRECVDHQPDFVWESRYQVRPRQRNFELCDKRLVIFLGFLTRPTDIRLTEHLGYEWFDWQPPHQIQSQTIDPLLAAVDEFFSKNAQIIN